jgi:hypothetical protein
VVSRFGPGNDDGWYTTTVDDVGPQAPDTPRATPRRGRPAPPRTDNSAPAATDGSRDWVELFNGGGLAHWKEDSQNQWQVDGGELIGGGPHAYLFTKNTFSNFHLRVEMKLESRGSASLFLRADDRRSGTAPRGHEVKVTTDPDPKTGEGTVNIATTGVGRPRAQRAVANGPFVRPDKRFTIDVLAQEKQLVVLIDGQAVSFLVDGQAGQRCVDLQQDVLDVGHLALQAAPADRARFQRVAVRELKRPRGARPVEVVSQPGGGCYLEAKSDLDLPQIWGWHAPAKFHGDHSDKFGTWLRYQVWTDRADAKNCRHVRLQGNDLTLVVDETTLPVPPAGAWKEQTIRLDRSGGWRKAVGKVTIPATDDDIKRALAAVTDLRITGCYSLEKDTGRLGTVEFGVPDKGNE